MIRLSSWPPSTMKMMEPSPLTTSSDLAASSFITSLPLFTRLVWKALIAFLPCIVCMSSAQQLTPAIVISGGNRSSSTLLSDRCPTPSSATARWRCSSCRPDARNSSSRPAPAAPSPAAPSSASAPCSSGRPTCPCRSACAPAPWRHTASTALVACISASNSSSSSPRRCAHGTSGSLSAPSDNSQADLVFTDAHALITIPMNRRAGDFSIFLTVFSGAIVL